MSLRSRRFPRLLLPVIAVMCLSAAPQQQLNPTVKMLPGATTPVPPECEEGLAPQPQPRVTPEEKAVAQQIVAPPVVQAPPTNELRSTLTEVQTAAERNDRAGFVDALARVKALLAPYPPGGERTAAEKAVAVYDDLDRVWAYQLTPAGAFFDASSDVFKMLAQYPGYDTFIRRQLLTDQTGAKFYPSSESRAFLTQLAATRLKDLGIRTATAAPPKATTAPLPVTRPAEKIATRPVLRPTEKPAAREKPATEHHVRAAAEKPKRATAATPKHREAAKAVSSPATKPPATRKPVSVAGTESAPKRAAAPVATKSVTPEMPKTTAAAPRTQTVTAAQTGLVSPKGAVGTTSTEPVSSATATAPPSVTGTTSTATTLAMPSAPATATTVSTATEAPTTDTSVTQPTGTPGQGNQPGKPNEPRNLLMPIILIVVGVGVLILLFRTSPGGK